MIRNAQIATMVDSDLGVIENGSIAIHLGKIAWVGDEAATPRFVATREVDLETRWVLPGLIDCHTHLVYAGNRADEFELRLLGQSYAEIAAEGGGILATVRATRRASPDELLQASMRRALDFLAEGVTTIDIKSGYGLDWETELKMLRVAHEIGERLGILVKTGFLAAHACPPGQDPNDYIERVCQMLPQAAKSGLVDYVDGFLETVGFNEEQIGQLLGQARQLGLAVRLHADQLSDRGGAGVAARFGALSADHLEYTSESSVIEMARAGTVAVLLPVAYVMLGETEKPPVEQFRAHGVPMAVSTDCNPGTAPCTSLTTAMTLSSVSFGLTPSEVLAGVTINAARALGIHHETGSLEVGKDADLSIWEFDHPRDLVAQIQRPSLLASMRRGSPIWGAL